MGRRRCDVLGIGQNALDRICRLDVLPPAGGKARLRDYTELPGGQVASAVLACARLGLRAAYVGAVGDDAAAEVVLEPLRREGVDVAGVRRVAGAPTQAGVILVDASGERSVLWHRDPKLALEPAHLSRAAIASARALLLDAGDLEAAIWAAQVARSCGTAVVLDADHAAPGVDALLAHVDFPLVSRGFAEAYRGSGSVRDALGALVGHGARLAAVTLGAEGAVARIGKRLIESPAYRVEIHDTTGAGDAFHGGFAAALLAGLGAEGALRTANATAALNCRRLGAQHGLPSREELDAFLKERGSEGGRQ